MMSKAPYTMFSATDFLPSYMTEFMNLVRTTSPYLASGMISRFSALWRRDIARSVQVFEKGLVRPAQAALSVWAGDILAGQAIRSWCAKTSVGRAYFGRLAPYFERRCLRFLTPWVSSTPRRMW